MRYFLRRRIPQPSRILFVESGSRRITDIAIPRLGAQFGAGVPVDLVTCFADAPRGVSQVYNVNGYHGRERRFALLRELRAHGYAVAAIVCSDEPMLNKWKWVLAAGLPAKILVVNENGDYFCLDLGHWPHIRRFLKHRAGVADAGIVRAFARIIVFPFAFSYLLLYAAAVHFRRALYRGFR